MVGVANVRPCTDGLYVPDDDGQVIAAILPVMPDDELIDLVAIDIAQPDRWWRRTGLGTLLGEDNTIGLGIGNDPLLVHPGPHEWLLASGEGVAILDLYAAPLAQSSTTLSPSSLKCLGKVFFANSI